MLLGFEYKISGYANIYTQRERKKLYFFRASSISTRETFSIYAKRTKGKGAQCKLRLEAEIYIQIHKKCDLY